MAFLEIFDARFFMEDRKNQHNSGHCFDYGLPYAIGLIWHNALNEHGYALVWGFKWLTDRIDQIQKDLLVGSGLVWVV